jgi:hypothetical protein
MYDRKNELIIAWVNKAETASKPVRITNQVKPVLMLLITSLSSQIRHFQDQLACDSTGFTACVGLLNLVQRISFLYHRNQLPLLYHFFEYAQVLSAGFTIHNFGFLGPE